MTPSTATISWNNPPPELREHIHYYMIVASHESQTREALVPVQPNPLYLFEYLEPATLYKFKISACNEYTRQCGNWSKEVEAETLDGGNTFKYSLLLRILVTEHYNVSK